MSSPNSKSVALKTLEDKKETLLSNRKALTEGVSFHQGKVAEFTNNLIAVNGAISLIEQLEPEEE